MADTSTNSSTSSWGAIYAGIQLGTALIQNHYARQTAGAARQLAQTQATSRQRVTVARNFASAAKAGLSEYLQEVNNERMVKTGEKRQAAVLSALALAKDAFAGNRSEDRVRGQQTLGAMAAENAFKGVLGGAADRMTGAFMLRQERIDLESRQAEARRSVLLGDAAGSELSNAITGQGATTFLPDSDASQYSPQATPVPPDALTAALKSGADFGRLAHGASDLVGYLQKRWATPTTNTTPGADFGAGTVAGFGDARFYADPFFQFGPGLDNVTIPQ